MICSDSFSALQSISKPEMSTKASDLALKIKFLTHSIRKPGRQVEFLWCPAHIGITGNEAADKRAKNAIDNGQMLESTSGKANPFKKIEDGIIEREEIFVDQEFSKKGIYYGVAREKGVLNHGSLT